MLRSLRADGVNLYRLNSTIATGHMREPHHTFQLDDDSREHTARVAAHLRERIAATAGWLPFEEFMAQALYAPGLGYYAAGNRKLAAGPNASDGDFITAPELSPLFAQTLAGPVAYVLRACDSLDILEFGAGTGALAAGLLDTLGNLGIQANYLILEVSADLRERQQQRLARFAGRVHWLDALPSRFAGCVVANEVLDAMPVRLFRWDDAGNVLERGVAVAADTSFIWQDRPAPAELASAAHERMPPLPGYISEVNLQAEAFMRQMATWLGRGAALFIDYGFPRSEYYHPQRAAGTLMCHLRHTAHDNPLIYPGIQDITAHVDFTAMADAAFDGGLDVLGYTSQSRFLMDAGLPANLHALHEVDPKAYAMQLNAVQKLISEAEMGELFKVLAVGKHMPDAPPGFKHDRLGAL